jgi:hypothetical protein
VSPGTVFVLALGAVISLFYLAWMWRALQRAVRTRDEADAGRDNFAGSFLGAIIAVVGSVAAVAVYGIGPSLLYAGPALALLSAVAVASCLRREVIED